MRHGPHAARLEGECPPWGTDDGPTTNWTRPCRRSTPQADLGERDDSGLFTGGSPGPCRSRWLREQSSGEIDAQTIAHSLADAPGTYVPEP